MKRFTALVTAFMLLTSYTANAEFSNKDIEKIWNTMDERMEVFARNAQSMPYPDPTNTELADYGLGQVADAFINLYLNENVERCQEYIQNVSEKFNYGIPHTGDYKTYFQMTIMLRIYYMFSHDSIYYPGRLTKESEDAICSYLWEFIAPNSKLEDASVVNLDVMQQEATGNHHVIRRTVYYLGSKILMEHDDYKNREYMDGHTPKEHFEGWQEYWKKDIVERAKRGLEVEYAANGYYKYTMDCFMCLREFSESSILRELAQKYLDVIFSDIGVLSNNGLFGGARGRSTRESNGDTPVETVLYQKWFNMHTAWRLPDYINPLTGKKVSEETKITKVVEGLHPNMLSNVFSSYTPPQPVADLVMNWENKTDFEYYSRPQGRGYHGDKDFYVYEFPSEYLRYSYVTDAYIIGSSTINKKYDYTDVCGQNRQYGIHFSTPGKQDYVLSRVFPDTESSYSRGFHDLNGFAYKNTMIMQSLPEARYYDANLHSDIYVVFTPDIYETHEIVDGWIFAYVPDGEGYIAVKPAKGKIKTTKPYDREKRKQSTGFHFTEKRVPIVMQAGSKAEYGSFENFKKKVLDTDMRWLSRTEFVYTNLEGDKLTVFTDTTTGKINGKTLNLAPENIICSPYLTSEYESGVYELKNTKGEKYIIRFEYDEADEVGYARVGVNDYIPDWNVNKLRINGALVYSDFAPVNENGELLISLRETFEELGAVVSWKGDGKTEVTMDGKTMLFNAGSNTAVLNGENIKLSSETEIISGKTVINSDVLSEYFDAKIKWDSDNNTVLIRKGVVR